MLSDTFFSLPKILVVLDHLLHLFAVASPLIKCPLPVSWGSKRVTNECVLRLVGSFVKARQLSVYTCHFQDEERIHLFFRNFKVLWSYWFWLCCCHLRRCRGPPSALLLPLPPSDWDISTGIHNDACLTESPAIWGIRDVSDRSAGRSDERSEVGSQKTYSLFLAPLIN